MKKIDMVFHQMTPGKWMTTTEIAEGLEGITASTTAQACGYLRREGSIRSENTRVKGEFRHCRIRQTRPAVGRRKTAGKTVALNGKYRSRKSAGDKAWADPALTKPTYTMQVNPELSDALDDLLNAAARLEVEVRELREYKAKTEEVIASLSNLK